jgi:N-acetylglucosaminyl-diphospho-decaprenol L-rhamnosyltransferase
MRTLSDLSIAIVSWNTRDRLRACLTSLEESMHVGARVVVVDNASKDGSAGMVAKEFPSVTLIRNRSNTLFAAATNQAAKACPRPYLMLLNPDTELRSGCLAKLATFLDQQTGHAAAAPRMEYGDGQAQHTAMGFPSWWTPLLFATPIERWWPGAPGLKRYHAASFDPSVDADMDQPPAAAFMVRRSDWDALGGFREELPLFFNDVDLCRRLIVAGRRIGYCAEARLVHHTGSATGQLADFAEQWHRDRLTYHRLHHGPLAGPWVKACTTFAWVDHAAQQWKARVRRRPFEPIGPSWRALRRHWAA